MDAHLETIRGGWSGVDELGGTPLSKNLLLAALAATTCVIFAIGCSKDEDDAAAAAPPGPDPVVGPTPAPPDPKAAPPPPFNFADGGPAPPADAGPDVAPVEVDPGAALGARVWGTDTDGRLLSFRIQAPDKVSVKLLTGLAAGEKILNVTFRPSNGAMYGLSNTSHLYTVNPTTGVATVVGDGAAFTPALMAQANGFDFNPVADRIRVHTDVDQDLRLDPTTGKVAGVDGMLAFAPGDVNAGQSPNLVGTGYTNSVTPAPATTILYAIDSTRNLLTRLPTPNDGMVETIGALGVDADQAAGFDISPLGIAYAALHVGGETALYTIDLATGAATKMGAIGYPIALTSIAVEP
jgi:hypothetical protein